MVILEGQAPVGHPQPQSMEIADSKSSNVGGPGGQQPVLDEYLDQLMRAREEQEKLDQDFERERLERKSLVFLIKSSQYWSRRLDFQMGRIHHRWRLTANQR